MRKGRNPQKPGFLKRQGRLKGLGLGGRGRNLEVPFPHFSKGGKAYFLQRGRRDFTTLGKRRVISFKQEGVLRKGGPKKGGLFPKGQNFFVSKDPRVFP